MRFIHPYFCFFLFFFSCNEKDNNIPNLNIINLKETPIETGNKVSDLIYNFSFIKLETSQECLIGEINKIVQFQEKLFILDRFNASAVFAFDTTGKFLFKLGSVGKGAGQFIYPHDLNIDSANKQILLLDSENHRINKYKIENGEFISSIQIPFLTTRFIKYGDFYGFVGGGKNENLIITNKNFKPLMNFFPREVGLIKSPHESFHIISDSLLLFQLNYKDTIYKIIKDRVLPYRRIEYGKSGISFIDFKSLSKGEKILEKYKDKRITYRYYFETTNTLFFTFLQNNFYYMVIVSKSDDTVKIIPYDKVVNDITYENNFPVILSSNTYGYFISIVDTEFIEKKGISNLGQHINRLSNRKLEMNSNKIKNPTLLFFKFK